MTNEEVLTLARRQNNPGNLFIAPFQASGNCVYAVPASEEPPTDAFSWKRQEKVKIPTEKKEKRIHFSKKNIFPARTSCNCSIYWRFNNCSTFKKTSWKCKTIKLLKLFLIDLNI